MMGRDKLLCAILGLFCMTCGLQSTVVEAADSSERITANIIDVDIHNVLDVLAEKGGVNIVTSSDVRGSVRIRLTDVTWDVALNTILKLYGYGAQRRGNIITVFPVAKIEALESSEALETEVITFHYLNATDAEKALKPQLSSRGKITIIERRGQRGWEFAGESAEKGEDFAKKKRIEKEEERYSRTIIITDIPPQLDIIRRIIAQIDREPRQILIQTRIMEVKKDKLKDLGVDWGTGSGGAETTKITPTPVSKHSGQTTGEVGGNLLGSQVTPSGFNPMSADILGLQPYNMGLSILYKKLTGNQFEVLLHALEEDVHTNTLSAPRIMTLENQEAAILIGTKYPILKADVTGTTTTTVTSSLDYYQDIGIQLNVVPQVNEKGQINMIIHPAVSSYSTTLKSYGSSNQVIAEYPIIQTREAETQVLIGNGETIVIGGLLKDTKTKTIMGIPFLSKIPLLGRLFRRETNDAEKIDLLIFITAHVIEKSREPAEILAGSSELLPSGEFPKEKK